MIQCIGDNNNFRGRDSCEVGVDSQCVKHYCNTATTTNPLRIAVGAAAAATTTLAV